MPAATEPSSQPIEYRFHAPTFTLHHRSILLYRIPSLENAMWTHFRVHYFNSSCNELVENEPRIRLARSTAESLNEMMMTVQPFGRARGTRHFREPIRNVHHDGGDLYLVIANPSAEIARIVLRLYGTTDSTQKT